MCKITTAIIVVETWHCWGEEREKEMDPKIPNSKVPHKKMVEESTSALEDNIAHKGRNAYYYAHGEWCGIGGLFKI